MIQEPALEVKKPNSNWIELVPNFKLECTRLTPRDHTMLKQHGTFYQSPLMPALEVRNQNFFQAPDAVNNLKLTWADPTPRDQNYLSQI